MTNSMFNPPPSYSGVTIQIANPAVNVGQQNPYCTNPQNPCISCGNIDSSNQGNKVNGQYLYDASYTTGLGSPNQPITNPQLAQSLPQTYPAQYYLNNYNYQNNIQGERDQQNNEKLNTNPENQDIPSFINKEDINPQNGTSYSDGVNTYKQFSDSDSSNTQDFTKSVNIIGELEQRQAEIEENKKNTKETKIVALTDEYIKSLENYLNNPNDEIRLMASKEILTRLDEDKDRFDDAALNALLNKMMQDPSKLVRLAAMSAFSSGLASGNDYTVTLLQNIQSNPNADKEDVLQAADILLRMTTGTEVKNIPNPAAIENNKEGQ